MEDLDLDSFIANIEQSAPQEDIHPSKYKCQECDTILEEVDGDFVCPSCSAQATNILQLEETEILYNDAGVAIVGQRVMVGERRKKNETDYGWAWSTDEAVFHLLTRQVKDLEKLGLVPEFFRSAIKNMWLKFWVENIAPHIRDEYTEEEFVPITVERALKLRDIEVLVKLRDKVMLPKVAGQKFSGRTRRMMGTRFFKTLPPAKDPSGDDSDSFSISDEVGNSQNSGTITPMVSRDADPEVSSILRVKTQGGRACKTTHVTLDNITILTLNRTLAFIEAAARCLKLSDPIFASDVIRACNQRLIPFFGAHKVLPEGMNLNAKDRHLFQKTRPPSPAEVTRAASYLIFKIYQDKLPISIPSPNLFTLLERFITDMNLPSSILQNIRKTNLDFDCFKQTLPIQFLPGARIVPLIPQYDRWAFAILIFHLKRLFVLDDKSLSDQKKQVDEIRSDHKEDLFVLLDWLRQMSLRLQLIMSHDPYVLFHPMADVETLEGTAQMHHYLGSLLNDKPTTTTRALPKRAKNDDDIRLELIDFLKLQLPRPTHLPNEFSDDDELQRPIHIRYPIQDAFARTKRFWLPEVDQDEEVSSLLFKDFSNHKVVDFDVDRKWTVFDYASGQIKFYGKMNTLEIPQEWPFCFKLLLSIGGFICYCEPRELLREYREVEKFVYPKASRKKYTYKRPSCRKHSKGRKTV